MKSQDVEKIERGNKIIYIHDILEKYKTVDHLPSGIKNNIHHVIVNEKDYIDIYWKL